MQVVILGGGLGTRLQPLTDCSPKSLVNVCGKPFLEYQLQWLASYGFRDLLLCVGHRAEQIRTFAGDGGRFGMRIAYSNEGDSLLGTAGALKKAEGLLEKSFCVLNGDSYPPIDPSEPARYFQEEGLDALMVTFRNRGEYDKSNAAIEDGFVTSYSRQHYRPEMEHIDYGFRIFKKDVLQLIPPTGFCDLDLLYQELIKRKRLAAFPVTRPFYEIGGMDGLARFSRYLEEERMRNP